jgi:hypothetical protein
MNRILSRKACYPLGIIVQALEKSACIVRSSTVSRSLPAACPLMPDAKSSNAMTQTIQRRRTLRPLDSDLPVCEHDKASAPPFDRVIADNCGNSFAEGIRTGIAQTHQKQP